MTNFVYVLGPAGSGKSTLVAALSDVIKANGLSVAILNLDPGAEWLPYSPDIDVRDYVTLSEVMEQYKLGPNGGLIVAVDLTINYLEGFKDEIDYLGPDYVIVDTPGQMELFAFREIGASIVRSLSTGPSAVLFLIDSFFASRPSTLASALLLSASTYIRFMLPQLNILTKIDLLPRTRLEKLIEWLENLENLVEELEHESEEERRLIARDMLMIVGSLGFLGAPLPVSAVKNVGLLELYAEVQRMLGSEGEVELEEELGEPR